MQLFYNGDIIEFRDRSQWIITERRYEAMVCDYIIEFENIATGEKDLELNSTLAENAIVIKFSDKLPDTERSSCKIISMAEFRQKRGLG